MPPVVRGAAGFVVDVGVRRGWGSSGGPLLGGLLGGGLEDGGCRGWDAAPAKQTDISFTFERCVTNDTLASRTPIAYLMRSKL